jgi:hypothetical protein
LIIIQFYNLDYPEHTGWFHAITSKSNKNKSLKKCFPFHPPNISILDPATKEAECPNLAEGDPLPSGPWYQVIVTGSSACKSLKTTLFSPFPPKIMILDPASIDE